MSLPIFHAALFGGFAHSDFAEGADRSRRHRLAAQAFESRQAFLTEEDQCAAIDAGGDVNQIRARHVGVNRRRAALVNVHLAGEERLRGRRSAQRAEIEVTPRLLK